MKNKILIIFLALCISLSAKNISLSEAYVLALDNSKKIMGDKYTFEANKENVNQVKSSLYPQINLNATYSDTKRELNSLLTRINYDEREKSKDYSVSLDQKIFDPEIYSKISLENQKIKLYETAFKIKKQELLKDVAKVYINILKQKNRISFAKSDLKYKKYYYKLIEKKHEKNLASKIVLIENKIELEKSKNILKKELALFAVVKSMLNNMIGDGDYSVSKISYEKISYATILNMRDEINDDFSYLDALKVKEAKAANDYAKKEISFAKSAYYPKLTFNFKYTSYHSNDISSDYENTNRSAIVLSLPLYQGGLTYSKVLSAKLKLKASNEELNLIKYQNKITVSELSIVFNSLIEEYKIYHDSLKTAELDNEMIKTGFNKGIKSIIDLYESKSRIDKIKYEYSNTLYRLIESYTSLLIATNSFDKLNLIDRLFIK